MSNRKPFNDCAGYVASKINPLTNIANVIYVASEAGIDADHKYVVVCECHKLMISTTSVPKARVCMKDASEWCTQCQEMAGVSQVEEEAEPEKDKTTSIVYTTKDQMFRVLGKDGMFYPQEWIVYCPGYCNGRVYGNQLISDLKANQQFGAIVSDRGWHQMCAPYKTLRGAMNYVNCHEEFAHAGDIDLSPVEDGTERAYSHPDNCSPECEQCATHTSACEAALERLGLPREALSGSSGEPRQGPDTLCKYCHKECAKDESILLCAGSEGDEYWCGNCAEEESCRQLPEVDEQAIAEKEPCAHDCQCELCYIGDPEEKRILPMSSK
jgi:hypothetical protein